MFRGFEASFSLGLFQQHLLLGAFDWTFALPGSTRSGVYSRISEAAGRALAGKQGISYSDVAFAMAYRDERWKELRSKDLTVQVEFDRTPSDLHFVLTRDGHLVFQPQDRYGASALWETVEAQRAFDVDPDNQVTELVDLDDPTLCQVCSDISEAAGPARPCKQGISCYDTAFAMAFRERHLENLTGEVVGDRTPSGLVFVLTRDGRLVFLPKNRYKTISEGGTTKKAYRAYSVDRSGAIEELADLTISRWDHVSPVEDEDEFARMLGSRPSHIDPGSKWRMRYRGSKGKRSTL